MRGHEKVIARLKVAERDELLVSVVTFAEIEFGIARAPKSRRVRELAELFEALLTYVEVATWDRAAAKHYVAIRVESEKSGKRIDQADLMIAAHAASLGATLVTADHALLQRPKVRAMPSTVNWLA